MADETHDEYRSRHRRPAVVLAIVGLVVVAGLFTQRAWTRFATMGMVAKTSEAVQNLEHIRQAQAAYFETHGTYLALGATPQRAPGPSPTAFASEYTDEWARLGWQPDSPVRCQYAVTVPTPTDFQAVARCDADGDGTVSVFISGPKGPPRRTSPDAQY